jgi:hypothetical protein
MRGTALRRLNVLLTLPPRAVHTLTRAPRMRSSLVSRASASVLLIGVLALLFDSDVLLPLAAPGVPPSAAWIGQLLAAAWLGLAALNWLSRDAMIGGIYGRPIVIANLYCYTVSALSLAKIVFLSGTPMFVRGAAAVFTVLAVVYGVILFRGPFDARRTESLVETKNV